MAPEPNDGARTDASRRPSTRRPQDAASPEERLLRLESDHARHQAALADYDRQMYMLTRRVERIEEMLSRVVTAMKELAESKQGPLPTGERPPHY